MRSRLEHQENFSMWDNSEEILNNIVVQQKAHQNAVQDSIKFFKTVTIGIVVIIITVFVYFGIRHLKKSNRREIVMAKMGEEAQNAIAKFLAKIKLLKKLMKLYLLPIRLTNGRPSGKP